MSITSETRARAQAQTWVAPATDGTKEPNLSSSGLAGVCFTESRWRTILKSRVHRPLFSWAIGTRLGWAADKEIKSIRIYEDLDAHPSEPSTNISDSLINLSPVLLYHFGSSLCHSELAYQKSETTPLRFLPILISSALKPFTTPHITYKMASRPQNIGIKAIEVYFPSQYVEQSELEKHDGASTGKYTIGLGQTKMAFCDDREDIYSFALTVVSNLLKKYEIDTNSIGRLEVGTETILDKSKSVKTVLMQLFGDNTSIEGVDTLNACYGGTNALFNTLNWIESSAWDGRDAIVVAGDIALYAKGNARPTGGAGAVALLVGPNAPIVAEPGLRGTYMQHAYDFYKPDLTSEYPYVDGHFSNKCYTKALDAAYRDYNKREAKVANGHANGDAAKLSLDRFDYLAFHAPNCKLVQKSYARLLYHDYLANADNAAFAEVAPELRDMEYETSLTDKVVEKTFMGLTKKKFQERVSPGIQVATLCGNMYCASVWGGLASLIYHVDDAALVGKRVGLFSYGSGLASSFMSFRIEGSVAPIQKVLDIRSRLEARRVLSPVDYEAMCDLRKKAHLQKDFTPAGEVSTIAPGTYYLEKVDDMFRREYSIKA